MLGQATASPRVGIVVPTLGSRPDYLRGTLTSLAAQREPTQVVVVGPPNTISLAREFGALYCPDPGGLSTAINQGVAALPANVEFVSWLGDDDELTRDSVAATLAVLDKNPRASACFGVCQYVDASGEPVWASRGRQLAPWIARFGPNLIPQPGSLIRRSAWEHVGGLDERLHYAMDLDLFLRLRRFGVIRSTPQTVARFRWHPDSTTVSRRQDSLDEAFNIRKANSRPPARWLVSMAYRPTVWATLMAARQVEHRTVNA